MLLHVTTETGEGLAIPITLDTAASVVKGVEKLLTPEGKRRVLVGLAELFLALTAPEKTEEKK